MFHACVQKFDVTRNLENFCKISGTKPAHGLTVLWSLRWAGPARWPLTLDATMPPLPASLHLGEGDARGWLRESGRESGCRGGRPRGFKIFVRIKRMRSMVFKIFVTHMPPAWLISHVWNYCWLICCERKILFVGWKSMTYKPSEHDDSIIIWHIVYFYILDPHFIY